MFLEKFEMKFIYLWIWLFGGATYQVGEEGEAAIGALMSNVFLISLCWYTVEQLIVPGSSNVSGAQQRRWKEMKEKYGTFCFIKLITKISPTLSGKGDFCVEVRSLLSKLVFTHSVSCWKYSHKIVEK